MDKEIFFNFFITNRRFLDNLGVVLQYFTSIPYTKSQILMLNGK